MYDVEKQFNDNKQNLYMMLVSFSISKSLWRVPDIRVCRILLLEFPLYFPIQVIV